MLKKITITMTQNEWAVLERIIDLGLHAISDAEYDYQNFMGEKRKSGYSADRRSYERFADKVRRKFNDRDGD